MNVELIYRYGAASRKGGSEADAALVPLVSDDKQWQSMGLVMCGSARRHMSERLPAS